MKLRYLVLPLLFASLTGCSVTKMAGNTVVEFTHDEAIPYLMSQGDLEAACSMGQSLGVSKIGIICCSCKKGLHLYLSPPWSL